MSAGKAVIATDVGGVSEAIADGVNGVLVKSEDHAALAQALLDLAADRERLRVLGEHARATFVERFTGDRFAGTFLSIIDSVLRRHVDTRAVPPSARVSADRSVVLSERDAVPGHG
jgi:glycosyltransferase involved in cell wall biosynthesis